jgi:hypothetical protein
LAAARRLYSVVWAVTRRDVAKSVQWVVVREHGWPGEVDVPPTSIDDLSSRMQMRCPQTMAECHLYAKQKKRKGKGD